jgi:hypothetical protein
MATVTSTVRDAWELPLMTRHDMVTEFILAANPYGRDDNSEKNHSARRLGTVIGAHGVMIVCADDGTFARRVDNMLWKS